MTTRQKYDKNKQELAELYEVLFKCESVESMNDISERIEILLTKQEIVIEDYKEQLKNKLNQN